MTQPWEKSRLEVTIIETHEAEIEGQHQKYYYISFPDFDGGLIEDEWPRKRFRHFPHPVRVGTYFGIVIYKEKDGKTRVGAWPLMKYWNPELRGN